jgi:sulfur-oxidizing protein SoxX
MKLRITTFVAATLLIAGTTFAQQSAKVDQALVAKTIADTFRNVSDDWKRRITLDDTQQVCSIYRNNPPQAELAKIQEREKASIVFPADGKLLGDWRQGEKLAQRGTGGQFSDKADTPIGGNCYACHQLDKKELSYGTLGPSLQEYGKIRKFAAEDAKTAYAKIYNAQSAQPCSNMPRFGHNKFLSEQDMKDLTAYLFDPESPVNK